MLIKNISVLFEEELDYYFELDIRIENDKFVKIKPNIKPEKNEKIINGEGLLLIPGFVNCHTHIGDSIGKDFTINSSVDQRIHPVFGVKTKILKNSSSNNLSNFIKNSCHSMIRKGITTFVDFREGGLDGVKLLRDSTASIPIRAIILGRVDFYNNSKEIKNNTSFPVERNSELNQILEQSDGLGISGANEYSDSNLNHFSKIKKIRAIHSSETLESVKNSLKITGNSETIRALKLKPDFLVHMTFASTNDLKKAAKITRGIVVCPRANASLAEGIPDIELMKKAGCTIGIGTDNVMINSPDMFREMDYLWKVTMGVNKKRIEPKEILKMATVNGEKILQKKIGIIKEGYLADCIFIDKHSIDLEIMHNPYAAIVHRASETSIRAVMTGGKIVHGKI